MSNERIPRRRTVKAASGQQSREKRDVHGWVVLDKPVGMTSTHAVGVVKRAVRGASAPAMPARSIRWPRGCLPIALGEATKTVPFVMDGRKIYRFTVRWGEETRHRRRRGRVIATSAERPTGDADSGAAAALHRHDRAGAAAIFGDQDRRRARLRSRPRRRDGRARSRGRSRSTGSSWSSRPTPITPSSRPNAARAPMSARSPATWAARSAATASVGAAPHRGRPVQGERCGELEALQEAAAGPPSSRPTVGAPVACSCPSRPRWRHPGAGRQPQRCGTACTRPGRSAARTGRAGDFGLHRGALPGLADGAGRGRARRDASAPDFQFQPVARLTSPNRAFGPAEFV